jgi:hypothetical protein
MTTPKLAHALDGGIPLLPTIQHCWPAASDEQRFRIDFSAANFQSAL